MFFPLLIGSFISLRITTPDPLAVALALWALWFGLRARLVPAILFGVAAVLTKEVTLLVLIGFALWRRDRDGLLLAGVPAAVAGAWWLWLRYQLPAANLDIVEFVRPLAGWQESVRFWAKGHEPLGLIGTMLSIVLAVVALVRSRLRHPLGWAVLVNLVIVPFLSASALAPERSGGRTTLALAALALIMVATPAGAEAIPRPRPMVLRRAPVA